MTTFAVIIVEDMENEESTSSGKVVRQASDCEYNTFTTNLFASIDYGGSFILLSIFLSFRKSVCHMLIDHQAQTRLQIAL